MPRFVLFTALLVAFTIAAAGAPAKKKKKAAPRYAAPRITAAAQAQANERIEECLQTPGTIEQPGALVPFFERLYRLKSGESTGPVRILHFGDSHTAADDWTGAL